MKRHLPEGTFIGAFLAFFILGNFYSSYWICAAAMAVFVSLMPFALGELFLQWKQYATSSTRDGSSSRTLLDLLSVMFIIVCALVMYLSIDYVITKSDMQELL